MPALSKSNSVFETEDTSRRPCWNSPFALPAFLANSGNFFAPNKKTNCHIIVPPKSGYRSNASEENS